MSGPGVSTETHTLSFLPVLGTDMDGDPQLYYRFKHASSLGTSVPNRVLWRWVAAAQTPLRAGRWLWTQCLTETHDLSAALSFVRHVLKAEGTQDGAYRWEICRDDTTFNQLSRGNKIPRMHGLPNAFSMVSVRSRPIGDGYKVDFSSKLCSPRSTYRRLEAQMSEALVTLLDYPPGSKPSAEECESGLSFLTWKSGAETKLKTTNRPQSTALCHLKAAVRPLIFESVQKLSIEAPQLPDLVFDICGAPMFRSLDLYMNLIED